MIELTIPGRGTLRIEHVVTDVSGTLTVDGQLIDGLVKRIGSLRDRVSLHMITADASGRGAAFEQQLALPSILIQPGDEAAQKADYVRSLGADRVVTIGQGANDRAMLKEAALGICVISREGAAVETMLAADIVVPDIFAALDLLDKPLRIIATLRK
ncbi:MAG: HAD family hydrolase [Bacteroidota bacterium]